VYPRDPASQALDIEVDEVVPGRARLRMRVTDRMLNGHGLAHGGYLFLLADAAFAYASNSHGPVALAQHAQIIFIQPATAGTVLVAEATERVRTGRTGIYDVTVRRADGATVAEFRGQSVVLARPS
jgi:acyl-CoA thioesterase